MANAQVKPQTNAPPSFEEQLKELESVVERLERGDLTLEENVSLFERGVFLSNACKKQLDQAESRVQVLLEPEGDGPVRVENLMIAVEDDDDLEDEVEIESGDDEE
jgi:exodeoxyribonuclease VII small subunit